MTSERQIIYVSPALGVFMKLAQQACSILAEQGKSGFDDPDVIRGLAEYLSYIAEMTSKYLNKRQYELLNPHCLSDTPVKEQVRHAAKT